jgi:isocitrate dehydrogenase
MADAKIIWTEVDEAPALATYALLPVIKSFTKGCNIDVEVRDISLAGRILAQFPERLLPEQRIADHLSELGEVVKTADANIIKLPNISASIPQLMEAIQELQDQGYDIPDYPQTAASAKAEDLRARFAVVLGSAVNPVLREGNSDRRAAASVKKFAQHHPHRMMKDWPTSGSQTRVAHMNDGDFFGSETSHTLASDTTVSIVFKPNSGPPQEFKKDIPLLAGEVIDTGRMQEKKLREFYAESIAEAKEKGVLLSLHLKATMMKISDPILFGHCVAVFYAAALDKHAAKLAQIGANVNNGLADVIARVEQLPAAERDEILADIEAVYESQPDLAMVDSRHGITNLHVPNNVIIDASMPVVVRDGGKMWNKNDELQDTLAMIPDRSYATMYQAIIEDCQANGQFDPATMGAVANVGLMAKKAEEYGSHDKTFSAPGSGEICVIDASGDVLLRQAVDAGDIFRMSQTKDEAIRDWVRLAVTRGRASGAPVVFWLDPARGHDAEIIGKVKSYLPLHDTAGLTIEIMAPAEAMRYTTARSRAGEDTISATGNVLRDYLTDLFPILELGTSARMLSIVHLLNGGGLFETGAGGSAPKHVQQFVKEGHLRWDSLGEYCALVPSLEMIAEKHGNAKAKVLASTLDAAISKYLEQARGPSRKVNEIDNRGSTFYLTLYWAEALAAQTDDAALAKRFAPLANELAEKTAIIEEELLLAQGKALDLGGYYHPDAMLAATAMSPSITLQAILQQL